MENLFIKLPARKFRKGQILIYEGDPVKNIYYLQSGYVKVSNILHNGSQRTIIIYKPGEAFPLTSFLSGEGIARFFYECMTDVEVRTRPQSDFQEMIKGNLEIGEELIAYTNMLSEQFIERIETLSAQSSRSKVVSLLGYLAKKSGVATDGKIKISIPLTSQEIADMCSLTRETASLQLIKLKREGLLSGRRFLVIDKAKLKKLELA
jgi:CRP/FNR family transcriptional regulator